MLQAPSLDLARAVDLIQALQDTLEGYREESYFDELWQHSVDIAKQCNIAVEAVEKSLQRLSFRLGGFLVESTKGQHRYKEGDKDKLMKGVFYPILDHQIRSGLVPLNSRRGSCQKNQTIKKIKLSDMMLHSVFNLSKICSIKYYINNFL